MNYDAYLEVLVQISIVLGSLFIIGKTFDGVRKGIEKGIEKIRN